MMTAPTNRAELAALEQRIEAHRDQAMRLEALFQQPPVGVSRVATLATGGASAVDVAAMEAAARADKKDFFRDSWGSKSGRCGLAAAYHREQERALRNTVVVP